MKDALIHDTNNDDEDYNNGLVASSFDDNDECQTNFQQER